MWFIEVFVGKNTNIDSYPEGFPTVTGPERRLMFDVLTVMAAPTKTLFPTIFSRGSYIIYFLHVNKINKLLGSYFTSIFPLLLFPQGVILQKCSKSKVVLFGKKNF